MKKGITLNFPESLFYLVKMGEKMSCSHGEVELLGTERGDKGVNRYYRCLKCGNVLVLSEEGLLYEIPASEAQK